MHDLAFVFAGFFVGFVVGLTGVGGGSLMTPILIFFFGIKPHLAIGSDLLFACFTKLGGTVKMARSGLVNWKIVATLCAGSVPASMATLWMLHQMGPADPAVQKAMTSTLGVALLLTAMATLYKAIRGKNAPRDIAAADLQNAATPRHWSFPILFGAFIGTLVTLTSVGAGAIGVTVLMMLYPRLPLPRIVAADIAYAVPLTLVAGLGHAGLGTVDWSLLAKLLIGSLPGIWLGSHMVLKTPDRAIRGVLSILLAYAGVKLLAL
jgi:uncharacterized protein